MPEIPEMETYKTLLHMSVKGKKINKVTVDRPKTVNLPAEEFIDRVRGRMVLDVDRRAKFLIFKLDDGNCLLTHMMLDGRLMLAPEDQEIKAQVVFILEDGSWLNFCHMGLGYLHYHNPDSLEEALGDLGVEPLSADFTWPCFEKLMKEKRGAVKSLLMNQKVIAGIGNAYSNEILFAVGLKPDRKVPELSVEENKRLYGGIPRILKEAIASGGYIETPFAAWDQKSGGFLDKFKIYERDGEACYTCGATILTAEIGGRNAFFCPQCQH